MRRLFSLVFLLCFTIPFGVSISGCSKSTPAAFCNAGNSGPVVGQVATITLQPEIFGVSLNQAQIAQSPTPAAVDCKGTKESVAHFTYATFLANGTPDMTIADVNPTTGQLCGGTWNRNTGGGIADFTTCNSTGKSGTAYLVASGSGVSSNPLPIFVHPVVTSVVLTPLATQCDGDNAATNCSPAAFVATGETCTTLSNGCCSAPVVTSSPALSTTGCISQSVTSQLAAKIYDSTGNNISCQVGHLTYAAQTSSVVTIDQNGIATAQQPGSTVITATVSNAGSSAGFFSTCPPKSIALAATGTAGTAGSTSISVNPNNSQPLNAIVTDINGTVLTGVALTYESTTPTTIAGASTIVPTFPGAAAITAVCQPPTCNPSPFNQIGLNGNGKPIASNPVLITSPGTQSTKLFIGSTNSRSIVPVDFAVSSPLLPVVLPYTPNSMLISNDGSSIYMGSQFAVMTFSATTNSVTAADTTVTGAAIGLSPDGTTLVISDPVRKRTALYTIKTAAPTWYDGVGTRAQFTPDSTTVYITQGDVDAANVPDQNNLCSVSEEIPVSATCVKPNGNLLIHSTLIGPYTTTSAQNTSDVTIAVPSVGAFFGGPVTTARTYCPTTTTAIDSSSPISSTTTNIYFPDASVAGPTTDRVIATNDGQHVLGATITPTATLNDLVLGNTTTPGLPKGECPQGDGQTAVFQATPAFTGVLAGVTASAITGIDPTSDSKIAFVTYQGSGGVLPTYIPQPTGAGTLGSITLSTAAGTPVAPIAGVVSSDNLTFYVSTTGDNAIHLVTKQADGTYKDTTTPLQPKLTDGNNNVTAPNLLVQKPRLSTS